MCVYVYEITKSFIHRIVLRSFYCNIKTNNDIIL